MSEQTQQYESILASGIRDFVKYKRALGCRYDGDEKKLILLDRYLVEQGVSKLDDITPDVLDRFMSSRVRAPSSFNNLLSTVRQIFNWLVLHERIGTSPLRVESKRCGPRLRPFLFDKIQARYLIDAAKNLPDTSNARMRGEIYSTIFALLYALGLRVSEATRLRGSDIDFEHKLLVIRQTKFDKNRLVPFGPRVESKLYQFLQQRERQLGRLETDHAVFTFSKGSQCSIHSTTVSWVFHKLVIDLGLKAAPGETEPHLHCLRHSFAVATLLRWYREGIDPAERLLYLSTFLGHVSPASTAVYLTITDELLQAASQRYESFVAPVLEEAKL